MDDKYHQICQNKLSYLKNNKYFYIIAQWQLIMKTLRITNILYYCSMAVDHENYMNHGTYLFVYLLPSICTALK